ncbi:hypothetical protein SLEP1_g48408 [Rubroshorea leprosula]|uniref:Uncharacterized protein n=1 Tax=Rubroshorea leprosula TaxID=152421 RepID=A0AAV5LWD7_9ROSI|nr:hypothetical protein SLEP1_g48408 [Rubroshorea leprosula]
MLQMAGMYIKYGGRTMEEFNNNVKKEIDSLRKCYDLSEIEKWNDEELAWMFLLDGCALLQFIFLDVKDKWKDLGRKNDRVAFAKLDIFLLEKQLPYQLLEMLIGLCNPSEEGGANRRMELKDSITEFLNKSFLNPVKQQQHHAQDYSLIHHPQEQPQEKQPSGHPPAEQQQIEIEVDSEEGEPAHLLALLRRRLIGDKSKEKGENQKQDKKSPSQQRNEKDGLRRRLMNLKCSPVDRHWHTFRRVKELQD